MNTFLSFLIGIVLAFGSTSSQNRGTNDFFVQPEVQESQSEVIKTVQENFELETDKVNLASWKSDKEVSVVKRVVDGDTIELESGKKLRYIGINTPESVDPRKSVECLSKEATQFNSSLVLGKEVWLEKDISETDRYGRLLRYVYLMEHDEIIFVNEKIVLSGYAYASSYKPDIKYQEKFNLAQKSAQDSQNGLWADGACIVSTPIPVVVTPTPIVITPQPTLKPVATFTPKPIVTPVPIPTVSPVQNTGSSWTCNCKKTCSQMSGCAEAQYQLNSCGCSARDGDHDGIACDADCQ